jgi:uncharacterized surface protein with fasciclin (FAS1) repeats
MRKSVLSAVATIVMLFSLIYVSCENEETLQNLLEIAQSTEGLESLVNVILYIEQYAEVDPEITEGLADASLLFTVFAPTNDAFVDVFGDLDEDGIVEAEDIRNTLGSDDANNAGDLGEVLGLHVIENQKLFVADILADADNTIGPTAYDEEGTVYLEVAVVNEELTLTPDLVGASGGAVHSTDNDIEALNGIAHILNDVLLPSVGD